MKRLLGLQLLLVFFLAMPLLAYGQSGTKRDKSITPLVQVLRTCSEKARLEFLDSMVFLDGRLAGAYIGSIEKCLGQEARKELFAHLGFLPNTYLEGYKCESRGTCKEAAHYVCTSNCISSK